MLTRGAVPTPAVFSALASAAGAASAAGNRRGGSRLSLTRNAETIAPGALRVGAFGQYVRYVVFPAL